MQESLFHHIVEVREPLLDRVDLARESLFIRVSLLAVKSVTCVQKISTRMADGDIARPEHRLDRGYTIKDCDVRLITWDKQEMNKHFTSVKLASTSL